MLGAGMPLLLANVFASPQVTPPASRSLRSALWFLAHREVACWALGYLCSANDLVSSGVSDPARISVTKISHNANLNSPFVT